MKAAFISAIGDTHCGSTVGLHLDEDTPLDDGGAYSPSPVQRWNGNNWIDFWKRVKAAAGNQPVRIIANGDLLDGNHHGTAQIVSVHSGIQSAILRRCFEPVLDMVRIASVVVVRGTAAHVGQGAPPEESFAGWLKMQKIKVLEDTDTGTLSWRHFKGDLGGVKIDVTHHGRTGGRPWTAASGVTNLAVDILTQYAMRRETPPDLAIRSHKHKTFDTYNLPGVRVLALPAWQLGTDWVKQAIPESIADLGGSILRIEGGRIQDINTITYNPKTPTRWRAM